MGSVFSKVLKVVAIVVIVALIVVAAVAAMVVLGIISATTLGLSAGAAASFATAFVAVAKAGAMLILGAIMSVAVATWSRAVAEEQQEKAAEEQAAELEARTLAARKEVEQHQKDVVSNSLGDWDGGSLGFTENYPPPGRTDGNGSVVTTPPKSDTEDVSIWPFALVGAGAGMLFLILSGGSQQPQEA